MPVPVFRISLTYGKIRDCRNQRLKNNLERDCPTERDWSCLFWKRRVTFLKTSGKKSDEMERKATSVLNLLRSDPTVTTPKIAATLGITERQARTVLDQMKAQHILCFERNGRSGRWIVHKPDCNHPGLLQRLTFEGLQGAPPGLRIRRSFLHGQNRSGNKKMDRNETDPVFVSYFFLPLFL